MHPTLRQPPEKEIATLLKPLSIEGWEHMHNYLEALCKMAHVPTLFRVHRGVTCTSAPLRADVGPGVKRECYKNASELAFDSPTEFTYFEGYALSELGFPIEHAWVVDSNGLVVDNTWDAPENCLYFGVPFDTTFLKTLTFQKGVWGVFGDWTSVSLLRIPIEEMVADAWREQLLSRPPCETLSIALKNY